MAWSLIASGSNPTGTSVTLTTTGADLFVAILSGGNGNSFSISDSLSNTWTLAKEGTSARSDCLIYYIHAPTTGAGQTFSAGADYAGGIIVYAYSGSAATPLDQVNTNNTSSSTTAQPGSITPGQNNELLVFAVSLDDPSTPTTPTVDSGFGNIKYIPEVSGNRWGLFGSTFVQSTAAAINPTMTRNTTNNNTGPDVGVIASFKGASSGSSQALAAASLLATRLQVGFTGNAPVTSKSNTQLFIRGLPSVNAALIGRATAEAMARAQAAGAVPLAGKIATAAKSTPRLLPTAFLVAISAIQSALRTATRGAAAVVARASTAAKLQGILSGPGIGTHTNLFASALIAMRLGFSSPQIYVNRFGEIMYQMQEIRRMELPFEDRVITVMPELRKKN